MTQPMEPTRDSTESGIISRPEGHLQDFPLEMRWEVTRRHSYYLAFWHNAKLYRQGEMGSHPAEHLLRYAASLMVGSIGVTGTPVDPSLSLEEWNDIEIDPAFLSGALQPMTFRAMAVTLINALSEDELQVLGALFRTAGSDEYAVDGDDNARSLQKRAAMKHLAKMPSSELDSYPIAPLFYVHMGASQRTILKDVENQARRWKQKLDIGERRVPVSKLPSYLEVWDLREGWTDNGYDRQQEHTLKEIAQQKKEPLSTIFNRYKSAFQMITGHPFSIALWWRLFAPLKISDVFNPDATPEELLSKPLRRHLKQREHRAVPESTVHRVSEECQTNNNSFIDQNNFVMGEYEEADFWIDLETLISRNLSNQEIAEQLDCDLDTIKYARERIEELNNK